MTPWVVELVAAKPRIVFENQAMEMVPLVGRVIACCVMEEFASGADTVTVGAKM